MPLHDYVQDLLKQGYTAEQIKSHLIRSGYPPYEVEKALTTKHIPWKIAVLSFFVLIMGISTYLLYPVTKTAPTVILTFGVVAEQTQITPGDLLTFQKTTTTSRPVTAEFTHQLINPQNAQVILTKKEIITLEGTSQTPTTVELPSVIPPGEYEIRSAINFNGKTQKDTFRITIIPPTLKAPVPPDEIEIEACPKGCEDFNTCTKDECVKGVCTHTPKAPCCGNLICENEQKTCPDDCQETRGTPTDVISLAGEQASTKNIEKASSLCYTLGDRDFDACFNIVAKNANMSTLCDPMRDSNTKDNCYMDFALTNDFTVCDKVMNRWLKNSCYSLSNLKTLQKEVA